MHRDIKPDNIMVGNEPATFNKIYLCDFGLCKFWVRDRKDPKCFEHIPQRSGKPLCGTIRYVGTNTHLGKEYSRGDDLETIGNMIMYFQLDGQLPWSGLFMDKKEGEVSDKEKFEAIKKKKLATTPSDLCKGQPAEFLEMYTYIKSIQFGERPDYDKLIGIVEKCMAKNNIDRNKPEFCWLRRTN